MLAATSFSLLIPAMELSNSLIAALGLKIGAAILHLVDRLVPHFHPRTGHEGIYSKLSKVWLFVLAITIHNFPEGIAVGVSFGSGDIATGSIVALALEFKICWKALQWHCLC